MFRKTKIFNVQYWYKYNKTSILIIQSDFRYCHLASIPSSRASQCILPNDIGTGGFFWSRERILEGTRNQKIKHALALLKTNTF
jgi:hypothetical protein